VLDGLRDSGDALDAAASVAGGSMKPRNHRTPTRARKGTKILGKQDRGRHVLKIIVRMPDGMDDPDAKEYSELMARHVANVKPRGAEVELTLRRHGDLTGNMLEGEAQAKRYSKSSKQSVEEADRLIKAKKCVVCHIGKELLRDDFKAECPKIKMPINRDSGGSCWVKS